MEAKPNISISSWIIDKDQNIIADEEGNPISREESDRIKASSENLSVPIVITDAIKRAFPDGNRPRYFGRGVTSINAIAVDIEKETHIGRESIKKEILKLPEVKKWHSPQQKTIGGKTSASETKSIMPIDNRITTTENACIWILAEIDKSGKIIQVFKNRKELN